MGGKTVHMVEASCLRYSLIANRWENDDHGVGSPSLNIGRYRASSCYLGGHIYIFGGIAQGGYYSNVVERLKVKFSIVK